MTEIVVILEDIRSALNVGAMFRTADGAGISKLILAGITPYPPHNRIPKTALGATESVDWKYFKDKSAAYKYVTEELKLPIYLIETGHDAKNYIEVEFPKRLALVLGNEIAGVSDLANSYAKDKIFIPMLGIKKSLNVSTSFGIIAYEILRQHVKNNYRKI